MKKVLMTLMIAGALSLGGCLNSDYSAANVLNNTKFSFVGGPANTTAYLVGEVTQADNPADNTFQVVFDATGKGSITFTAAEAATFRLSAWGNNRILDFKFVKTPGSWAGDFADSNGNVSITLPEFKDADSNGNATVTIDLTKDNSYTF